MSAQSVHECKIIRSQRKRVTGWLVKCSECGVLVPGHYSKDQAAAYLNSHVASTTPHSNPE